MSRCLRFTPLLFALVTACDPDDPDDDTGPGGGDTSADCGSADAPTELTIADVAPAPGSTVPNVDVVHRFVIVDSPGVFTDLLLAADPSHTAGSFDSEMPQFTVVPRGDDLEYSLQPLQWGSVGHVQMNILGLFADGDGCHYAFPEPLFDYDLTDP